MGRQDTKLNISMDGALMQDIAPISQTGHEKLREELSRLEKESVELGRRVAEARAMGDLKENGEYIYGRQNLGFVEGRIGEIKGKLSYSQIVDCTQVTCDRAGFGTAVTLLDLQTQKKVVYHLLGPHDAELSKDGISILSPVGKAIVGRAVGDKFSVMVPRGERHLELLEIDKLSIK
jgi:transcription elongation factor GreA